MNIISECAVLFLLILNMMCTGQGNEWSITFNPAEVTAVTGVCALISCTFTYPYYAEPIKNIQWRVRENGGQFKKEIFKQVVKDEATTETERIKMLEADVNKNNCSFIMKDIRAEDEQEYAFRVEGSGRNTYVPRVKIIIQDQPRLKTPCLREGEEANLTCSAPFPCPETPPDIKWWIKTREENITDLNTITLTTIENLYLSTLTLNPTSDLHRATVGCDVSYGNITISTNGTLDVMYVQTPVIQGKARLKEAETLNLSCSVDSHPPSSDPVWSFSGNTEILHNQTSAGHLIIPNVTKEHAGIYICGITYVNKTVNASIIVDVIGAKSETNESFTPKGEIVPNTTGIVEFMKNLNIATILTFVAGMAFSALIFSMILCCWVSCHRHKKQKVPTANPDNEINLETVQTDVAQTGTSEQTPLHEQPDNKSPNSADPTDRAEEEEEEEAVGTAGQEVDYASIDYSLLKNRAPEEEKEPADTEYAEIKKIKKKSQDQQDEADPTPSDPEQTTGDDEIYSNSQMMNSEERINHTQH